MTKIILYSSIDLEPITVIDIPFKFKNRLYESGIRMFDVPVRLSNSNYIKRLMDPKNTIKPDDPVEMTPIPIITVQVDFLHKNGLVIPMFFTSNEEFALLTKSSQLPGQVDDFQEEYKRGFQDGVVKALNSILGDSN